MVFFICRSRFLWKGVMSTSFSTSGNIIANIYSFMIFLSHWKHRFWESLRILTEMQPSRALLYLVLLSIVNGSSFLFITWNSNNDKVPPTLIFIVFSNTTYRLRNNNVLGWFCFITITFVWLELFIFILSTQWTVYGVTSSTKSFRQLPLFLHNSKINAWNISDFLTSFRY